MRDDQEAKMVGGSIRTVALSHIRVDDVVADELEVGVADPVADRGLRAGEEVVEDSHLVAEQHEAVDKVRAKESGTTSNEDALLLSRWKELHGGEAVEGGVGDSAIGVNDGRILVLLVVCVVRRQPQGTKCVDGHLAVEPIFVVPSGGEGLPIFSNDSELL